MAENLVYVMSFQNQVVAVFALQELLKEQMDNYDWDKIELIEFYD